MGGTPGEPNTNWISPVERCTCGSEPVLPLPKIIISEVLFKPDTGEKNDEWIELYNNGCVPINLTGWRIGDVSLTDGMIPLEGADGITMMLDPGAYAVVIPGNTGMVFVDGTQLIQVDTPKIGSNLNDDIDSIFLYDDNANQIDTTSWNFPNGAFPGGNSIERTSAADNTSFRTQGDPSPGGANDGFNSGATSCCGDTEC